MTRPKRRPAAAAAEARRSLALARAYGESLRTVRGSITAGQPLVAWLTVTARGVQVDDIDVPDVLVDELARARAARVGMNHTFATLEAGPTGRVRDGVRARVYLVYEPCRAEPTLEHWRESVRALARKAAAGAGRRTVELTWESQPPAAGRRRIERFAAPAARASTAAQPTRSTRGAGGVRASRAAAGARRPSAAPARSSKHATTAARTSRAAQAAPRTRTRRA